MRSLAPLAAAPAAAPAAAAGEAVPALSATPVLGALAAVVAAIFLAAFVVKRAGLKAGAGGALLKPVATLALGARERLVVVQVADRWLVLGVTAQSIQALADLEAGEPPAAPEGAPAFAGALAKALGRHAKP